MTFIFTPEDAQDTATRIVKALKREYKIRIEDAFAPNAPYRTTLIVSNRYENILIDVQTRLNFHEGLKDLMHWIVQTAANCELYLALNSDTDIPAKQLAALKKEGVGIILEDDGKLEFYQRAKNYSFMVKPNPALRYGKYQGVVNEALTKFNDVNRKDGLRDICETFENCIEDLGIKACNKGLLVIDEAGFKKKKLSEKIDLLAAKDAYTNNVALVDDPLKIDLHAFRNARNLLDHKARSLKEENRRELQFTDKMTLAPRLIHELETIRRRIK